MYLSALYMHARSHDAREHISSRRQCSVLLPCHMYITWLGYSRLLVLRVDPGHESKGCMRYLPETRPDASNSGQACAVNKSDAQELAHYLQGKVTTAHFSEGSYQ